MANIPNFDPIIDHISKKLKADLDKLHAALDDTLQLRDFAVQNTLLSQIQAGVRAVDVLIGQVDLGGTPKAPQAPQTPTTLKVPVVAQAANPNQPLGTVDLEALSREIEGEGKQ